MECAFNENIDVCVSASPDYITDRLTTPPIASRLFLPQLASRFRDQSEVRDDRHDHVWTFGSTSTTCFSPIASPYRRSPGS